MTTAPGESLAPDSHEPCGCGHEEWRHVWNSVPLDGGRGPFSVAACAVEGCGCADYVSAAALEAIVNARHAALT